MLKGNIENYVLSLRSVIMRF